MRTSTLAVLISLLFLLPRSDRAEAQHLRVEHMVLRVEGTLSVKREAWTDFTPVSAGSTIVDGNLVKLESGSEALLACADVRVIPVPVGIGAVPCARTERSYFTQGDLRLAGTRSGNNLPFPVLMSPRRTAVREANPVIRWQPAAGIAAHRVIVRGPGVEWETTVTGTNQVTYPESAPPLQPGGSYAVVIRAGTRSSTDDGARDIGFWLLGPEMQEELASREEDIRAAGLPDVDAQLLQARLLGGSVFELRAEAVAILERLLDQRDSPAERRLLGELYARMHLNGPAVPHLERVVAAMVERSEPDAEAFARVALGCALESLPVPPPPAMSPLLRANEQFRLAATAFRMLGGYALADQAERLADRDARVQAGDNGCGVVE